MVVQLTSEISSSGCINLELKPEADSGFFSCGAPVIVACALGESVMLAAEGNVGLVSPDDVEGDITSDD